MKFSRKRIAALLFIAGGLCVLRAELSSWAQNAVAGSAIEAALFRTMTVPLGTVSGRRPPSESRADLTGLIQKSPRDAELYSLRAREDERALDVHAAEIDWRRAAELSSDKETALNDLARFYHRRVEPQSEIDTLLALAALSANGSERFKPDSEQPQWMAFERALHVSAESLLGAAVRGRIYDAWIGRYPKNPATIHRVLGFPDRRQKCFVLRSARFPD